MSLIIHNIKVAVRNIEKYKLQSLISVLSIAVGILTLSFAHSFLCNIKLNALYDLPFIDRTYNVTFRSVTSGEKVDINGDIVRTLKKENALTSAEHVVVPISGMSGTHTEFTLLDSTKRIGHVSAECIDPDFLEFAGFRSAITGKPITKLKKGEAIIGEDLAKKIFQDQSPIGCIQEETGPIQPIPVKIVDVYKSIPLQGSAYGNSDIRDELLFSLADCIVDQEHDLFFLIPWINVVSKEGNTEQQLTDEINRCVLPYGVEAVLDRTLNKENVRLFYAFKAFIYLFGSLILVAAIIGFLRSQIQLFWMRRGEIALRIVNGAYRRELFTMLVTEPFLIICLSVLTAILLGFPLQEFFQSNRTLLVIESQEIKISGLWLFSVEIGISLFIVVALMAWLSLDRVCNNSNRLAVNMRRSRSHAFRNFMLGLQTAVCLVFVCTTLLLVNTGRNMLDNCNIPEKDKLYSECLVLRTDLIRDEERSRRVCEEISLLPEVERVEMYRPTATVSVPEIRNNPETFDKMDGYSSFFSIATTDKELLSFFGIDIEWLPGDFDRDECLLIGEDLYHSLKDAGALNGNTLSVSFGGPSYSVSLPVGGLIKNIPYTNNFNQIVVISQYCKDNYMNMTHIVIPKEGKGKNLDRKIDRILRESNPENILNDNMINNYRDIVNWIPSTVSTVYVACLALGSVSLLICAMGIFSAIALDTRGRRKEVAIRKVNGAKALDIYRMFGSLYVILIATALVITIPVCVYFARALRELMVGSIIGSVSPYMPIMLGSIIVILLILLIVNWQIQKVLQTDTSKIISKE